MDEPISQLIRNRLLKDQEEGSKRKRSGKISPSSFGQCFRRQWFNWKNEPKTKPVDERVLAIFKCGNLFEEFVFSVLPESIERQVRIETEECLGFADGVNEESVIDCKSQNSRKFWWIAKEKRENPGFSIKDHNPDHILQVGFYAWQLRKKFLVLIYVSKDDLCTEEYKIPITDGLIEEIKNEINTLKNSLVIPPAVPRLYGGGTKGKGKECDYCAWKDKCLTMEG